MTHPWLQAVDAEFAERLTEDRLPHALLLSGPRETGKPELATGFVASVLCLETAIRHAAPAAPASC